MSRHIKIKSSLAETEMSKVFSRFLQNMDLLNQDDSAIIFYDLSFLDARVSSLKEVFPKTTLHAIAVKANPLAAVLKKINTMGVGLEVASLPELHLAEKAGFTSGKIVFDSPCKTVPELEYALKAGVYVNADSFEELDRIARILETIQSKSIIGVRINPQVGAGTIRSTSVAGTISKFGIPVQNNKEKIVGYFLKYDWLRSIHVHIGSQGCPVSLLTNGIRKVLDLALEINESLEKELKSHINTFDMGGGLPVSYHQEISPVSIEQYCSMLAEKCPELFDGRFKLITEFGRYIYANSGWVASKVEYVKREPDYNIIMTHVGADLFLRKCYNPGDWHHQITLVDRKGDLKSGIDKNKYIVAGPLCFAGDVIARELELPVAEEGDYILIHDAGAYTLSMWSRYNSRQIPKVIGYKNSGDTFDILKERETLDDLLGFWS